MTSHRHPPIRIVWPGLAVALLLLLAGRPAPAAGPEEVQPPPLSPSAGAGQAPAPVSPVPMASPAPPPSDHDAVVGHWGIEARRIAAAPYPLTLQSPTGCPTAVPPPPPTAVVPCTVDMGAISVRHWQSRNLAWNLGLAFALGGGRQGSTALDTHYGVGPILGLTLLLGNWRHLAVGASPEASFVYFKPSGGSSPSTKLVALRAQLEGELHFGFIDVPALSVGITTGLAFDYESAPGASTWSVSVGQARSVWGTLSNIFIRYYL